MGRLKMIVIALFSLASLSSLGNIAKTSGSGATRKSVDKTWEPAEAAIPVVLALVPVVFAAGLDATATLI